MRPKKQADDWVWIVDHTVQIGIEKCFVMVGIRLCNLPPPGECLKHEDLEPISLLSVTQSNGEIVYQQLVSAVSKTGVPRQIVGDYGSDLKCGIDRFCQQYPQTSYSYDIKHKTAILLKKELENDPNWESFTQLATLTKNQVQQTKLAPLAPPHQRTKSRYIRTFD